jgi:hypothetical protein
LGEPGWIDIKGRMSATPKQTFDVYRKRTKPTLRLAVAPGGGLPRQFPSKDWTLVEEPSVLHSDVSEDFATKGYCYFQLVKVSDHRLIAAAEVRAWQPASLGL